MNILLVNKFYAPTIGGVEHVVKQHGGFLTEAGYEVTVLCCKDSFSLRSEVEERNGVRVVRCLSLGTFLSMPISPVFPFWLMVLAYRSGLVMSHLPFPLGTLSILLLPFRRPIFVYWHSDIVQQRFFKGVAQFLQRLLCGRAERIFTTSPRLRESSKVLSAFGQKVSVIPLSVPCSEDFSHVQPRPNGLPDFPDNFALFLGRLCYYKGIDVLLDAVLIMRARGCDSPVVIVGDGPLKGHIIRRLSSDCFKGVYFFGRHVSEDEKVWLLGNCSMLLFPSVLPSEAFGIMQLEAMAFGKPVVNTDLPSGVPWVSRHEETGLTVTPGDAQELASAITYLSCDPDLQERYGQNARRRVENYFSDQSVRDMLLTETAAVLAEYPDKP